MELRSDNAAGAAPEIIAALSTANTGSAAPYGDDELTAQLTDTVRTVFERPNARVFPVLSGTAANSIGLAALTPPWGAVLCHETAHVLRSEGGATSMFSGGAVMHGLAGENFRIDVAALHRALDSTRWGDPHHSQPSVLSLTSPSDYGTVYGISQIRELTEVARSRGLRVHLDGARIANALVALGCTPAELTWRSGIDVVSLGATKNGALSTDAIVCFDDAVSEQLVYRVKRAGHVASKMRFQSAQLQAYLTDGLWLRLAATANTTMARLARGVQRLGLELVAPADANMIFVRIDDSAIDRLEQSGLLFYRMGSGMVRFVTSFRTTEDEVDDAIARIAGAL
ncbi:MAG: low specificity L-threonine aldolase [Actinobacteria bacterium]|nr:low specificity L-threonine aldolase [Actinomycetota bacterium]